MNRQIYVHYGSTAFDSTKGFPIKNEPGWVKPKGGLWASRLNANFGWKEWCEVEHFSHSNFKESFQFVMRNGSNVVVIKTLDDLKKLPIQNGCDFEERSMVSHYWIDFEKCLELGIDAIELCIYGDEYEDSEYFPLHFTLYGWDCDSIVVLNPNAIILQ